MHRKIASYLAVLMVGLMLGVGTVAMADRGGPTATASSSPDVVSAIRTLTNEVRTTNRKLDIVNRNLGGYTAIPSSTSLSSSLKDIERNTSG